MTRMHILPRAAFIIILASAASGKVCADTPLEPVNEITFCSKNDNYCAHSTVHPAYVEVFEKKDPRHVIWSRNEYVTKGFLSDDGKTVVSCYAGLNLIPLDATLDFLLVRMLRASRRVQEIRLGALYADIHELPHTDSHLEWGRCLGIVEGRLLLERVDGTQWRSAKL